MPSSQAPKQGEEQASMALVLQTCLHTWGSSSYRQAAIIWTRCTAARDVQDEDIFQRTPNDRMFVEKKRGETLEWSPKDHVGGEVISELPPEWRGLRMQTPGKGLPGREQEYQRSSWDNKLGFCFLIFFFQREVGLLKYNDWEDGWSLKRCRQAVTVCPHKALLSVKWK